MVEAVIVEPSMVEKISDPTPNEDTFIVEAVIVDPVRLEKTSLFT